MPLVWEEEPRLLHRSRLNKLFTNGYSTGSISAGSVYLGKMLELMAARGHKPKTEVRLLFLGVIRDEETWWLTRWRPGHRKREAARTERGEDGAAVFPARISGILRRRTENEVRYTVETENGSIPVSVPRGSLEVKEFEQVRALKP